MAGPFYSGDVPAVVVLRPIPDGGHVRVRVWVGQEGSPGHVGDLVMRPKDWALFKHLIAFGSEHPNSPKVTVNDEPPHADYLPPPLKVVSDERVEEILAGLNDFVVHEYETESNIVFGRAVHSRVVVGTDYNLDHAIDWALDLPETSTTSHSDQDASVELVDGTVLEWFAAEKQWVVTVDEPEAQVSS